MNCFNSTARVTGPCLAKDIFDRSVTVLLLLVMLPWLVLIGLALLVEGAGPVLCGSPCQGVGGRSFVLLRFRTRLDPDLGPTRIGSFLQRYSLDELPQLFNVLAGDMSLVGPRPQASGTEENEAALPVKPGLTGLWYLGRSPRLNPDGPAGAESYVRDWSLALDVQILWLSLRSALGREFP